ncbi:MAG: 3-hydroxyisobutyrate dehydrogenase [Rhizobiaceae bacterium]|nr:3-hydroxyisobutyrate dehydrogenase [Rhizobiaceae bacterium]
MAKIGFVGLGNMGFPMALNLKNAGHEVTGFDVSEAAREAAISEGMNSSDSLEHVADGADIVITMLPNGEISKTVASQLLPSMLEGSLLIDCSTIDVASAKTVHQMASDAGKLCLDAPVSGGVGGASAGTLTFMVGGSDQAFSDGSDALDVMGQKAVHCGGGGAGQSAKICNNMLLAISMIGTCEAFAMAEKLGLDQDKLFDVVSTSSGSCWSVNTYCPVPNVGPKSPSDNNYQPGFAASLMNKDLNLAMEAASDAKAQTPLGAHAAALYKAMVENGHGDLDFSAMINILDEMK